MVMKSEVPLGFCNNTKAHPGQLVRKMLVDGVKACPICSIKKDPPSGLVNDLKDPGHEAVLKMVGDITPPVAVTESPTKEATKSVPKSSNSNSSTHVNLNIPISLLCMMQDWVDGLPAPGTRREKMEQANLAVEIEDAIKNSGKGE